MPRCLLGLGANLGDREQQLNRALELLARETQLIAVSQYLATTPVGGPANQGVFLNAAAMVETDRSPIELWHVFRHIESALGRERGVRWEARAIDLDLLLYDDVVLQSDEVTLPHPWMIARRFVLQPASEIAADWVHPVLKWTVAQLWDHAQHARPRFALAGSIDRSLGPAICQQTNALWIPAWSASDKHSDLRESLRVAEESVSNRGWNRADTQWMLADFWWKDILIKSDALDGCDFLSSLDMPKLVFIGSDDLSGNELHFSSAELRHSARLLQLLIEERRTIGVVLQASETHDVIREIAGAMKAIESS